ncbi:Aminomethyltransferase (glycine cleavage system T protein) [hydrothermal vent metagenome]|uniref:aminomethyltransferase n=1 Tax=hydrothermal vent metagenome TaxID=652676 RepID=A0A3B1CMD8_9ZZZZ
MTPKNTPLADTHKALGAKMLDFHGWMMPIQYTSILEEHKAVREKVGIFDVSHMGEIEIKGDKAFDLVQYITTNDVSLLEEGEIQYSALLNEKGGVIDDLLVYKVSGKRFLLCVNASNAVNDLSWIADQALRYPDVEVVNSSRRFGMISIQGPKSEPLLQALLPTPLAKLGYYRFCITTVGESNIIVSRTGYTGEDGFEIFCEWRDTPAIWEAIMVKGRQFSLKPIGLGARDTLRLEMRYALHGQELAEDITPLEAGLSWIVSLDKQGGFIGRDVLLKQKEEGVPQKLVGFEVTGRGIARTGYAVYHGDEVVGRVTSGAMSPSLKKAVGMAYVKPELAVVGAELFIEIRGKKVPAVVRRGSFVESRVKKEVPATT